MSAAATGAAVLPRRRARPRALAVAGFIALFAGSVALFLVSRGKWSDAIIDSGREWIVPDALARGELLYRDVVYWFGPFTPYFHAAFFALFGSSFQTLVVAGIVASIGVLAALHFALRSVTGRREAALWTALAIPALVFMPNAGGSILGMGYRIWHAAAFALLAVTLAARPRTERRSILRAIAVGCLCALAGLCRTEWGIGALLSCFLALGIQNRFDSLWVRDAFLMGTAALALFGGVLGVFVVAAGAARVLFDAPVLLFGLPDETWEHVVFAGPRRWRSGLVSLLYSSLMWTGAVVAVEMIVLRRGDPKRARKRLPLLLAIVAVLGVLALISKGSGAELFSAAPLVCLAALVAGTSRRGNPHAAAVAGFGLLGLLVSHRRFLQISDAPYVAPPLLFAFVSAAALLGLFVVRERDGPLREKLRNGLLTGMAVLTCFAFAGRLLQYRSDSRLRIPGTHGMLSARPELASEISGLAAVIRREAREGDGLVVFPEGEVLNYLSGHANPIRHKLYLPGYLTRQNESAVLAELSRAKPAAVVLWSRMTGEYGRSTFGVDYGSDVYRWVEKNYAIRRVRAPGMPPRANPSFRYGVRESGGEKKPE